MKTESEEMSNKAPTERGWYWVETNPAWKNGLEVVFLGYPEYDDRLHVYEIGISETMLLDDYCRKYPRRWVGKINTPIA